MHLLPEAPVSKGLGPSPCSLTLTLGPTLQQFCAHAQLRAMKPSDIPGLIRGPLRPSISAPRLHPQCLRPSLRQQCLGTGNTVRDILGACFGALA